MNPWWIYFLSSIKQRLPKSLCPSCGAFIRQDGGKLDPEHILCDRCYKDFTKIKMPKGKKKGS